MGVDVRARWRTLAIWLAVLVPVALYVLAFSHFIDRHTALPFFDGYDYVHKTHTIAEAIGKGGAGAAVNPMTYLEAQPRQRPPLMMAVAAWVLGEDARAQEVAREWMLIRAGVLIGALAMLARVFKSPRFAPAAALLILASPLSLTFYRLYMVDEPFGLFGLLVLAAVLLDDQRETWWSAALAAAAVVMLLLVKPVAPAFVLPILGVRMGRVAWKLWQSRGAGLKWANLVRWAIPYGIGGAICAWLMLASPYGVATTEQYRLGSSTGYWTTHLSFWEGVALASFVVSPVLVVAALATWRVLKNLPNKFVLVYGAALLAWWLVFSMVLSYSVEDRFVGMAMPAVLAAAALFVCQHRAVAKWLTVAAAVIFAVQLSLAANLVQTNAGGPAYRTMNFVLPLAHNQWPTQEIGLLPLAAKMHEVIPADKPTTVIAVFGDLYLEPGAMNFALQGTAPKPPSRIHAEWVPIEGQAFDFSALCKNEWFLTTDGKRSSVYENTGLFVSIEALNRLLTDPESPLRPYLTAAVHARVAQDGRPVGVTLWRLREPPAAVRLAALKWIAGDFKGSSHEAYIGEQIRELEKAASSQTAPATPR